MTASTDHSVKDEMSVAALAFALTAITAGPTCIRESVPPNTLPCPLCGKELPDDLTVAHGPDGNLVMLDGQIYWAHPECVLAHRGEMWKNIDRATRQAMCLTCGEGLLEHGRTQGAAYGRDGHLFVLNGVPSVNPALRALGSLTRQPAADAA